MNLLSSLLNYTARQIAALRAKDTSQDTEISGAKGRLTTAESNISTLTSRIETAISAVTTDTEVTDIRVGYDGVTYGTAGTAVRTQFVQLKSDLEYLFKETKDLTNELVYGYTITNQNVGETVPTTIRSSNTDKCGIFPCRKGDIFTITGMGGQTNRTWAFTDTDYKMLSKAGGSAQVTDLEKTATQDGFFFFNSMTNKNPKISITTLMVPTDINLSLDGVPADAKATGEAIANSTRTIITDPKDLAWLFGELSAAGTVTYNDNGVVNYEPIHILKGSTFEVLNNALKYNIIVTFDDGTTAYKGWNALSYIMPNDGYVRISVGNSNGNIINNLSLLDNFVVSLIVDDAHKLASPFIRTKNMLGLIPISNYVGKHIDTTGFNQTTDYASAIQPWRELPNLASGYISETDLGEVTDGYHQYRYDLVPPNRFTSGKKLPRIFIVTSQHGHEKSATYGMLYLIKDMLEHSMEDPVLFYLRNYVKWTIIPIANPYGWDATSSLGTHGGIRQNKNGVNLNRNYGTSSWADFDDNPDYTTEGNYNYRGSAPFSETETQRIKQELVKVAEDTSLLIDIHTYGTDTNTLVSITYVGANNDSDAVMQKMPIVFGQYLCGVKNHMDQLYDVNLGLDKVYGSSHVDTILDLTLQDYGYNAFQIPSVTLEVPCGSTSRYLGDQLTKYSADIIKLCGEMIGNYICKNLESII